MECKSLRDSGNEIQKFDVAYFMASTDKPEDNKEFAMMHQANFPILSDPSKTMSQAYGVNNGGFNRRWTYYIDANGTVQLIDKQVLEYPHMHLDSNDQF